MQINTCTTRDVAASNVAVCCSVLQCGCTVLQFVQVLCSALQCIAVRGGALYCVAVYRIMLQYVAVSCSLVQCVAGTPALHAMSQQAWSLSLAAGRGGWGGEGLCLLGQIGAAPANVCVCGVYVYALEKERWG